MPIRYFFSTFQLTILYCATCAKSLSSSSVKNIVNYLSRKHDRHQRRKTSLYIIANDQRINKRNKPSETDKCRNKIIYCQPHYHNKT